MHTPVRILRKDIEDIPGARPVLSARERERQNLILAAACRVLARHGRIAITIASLAGALSLSPGSIKRLFPDMDSLVAEILRRHIAAIAHAIAGIESTEPDCFARRRAAYLAMTRNSLAAPVEAHLLLQEIRFLPPDLRGDLEAGRTALGELLAGEQGAIALELLDMPDIMPQQIEACLARTAPQQAPTPTHRQPFRLQIEPPQIPQARYVKSARPAMGHHTPLAARAGPDEITL